MLALRLGERTVYLKVPVSVALKWLPISRVTSAKSVTLSEPQLAALKSQKMSLSFSPKHWCFELMISRRPCFFPLQMEQLGKNANLFCQCQRTHIFLLSPSHSLSHSLSHAFPTHPNISHALETSCNIFYRKKETWQPRIEGEDICQRIEKSSISNEKLFRRPKKDFLMMKGRLTVHSSGPK